MRARIRNLVMMILAVTAWSAVGAEALVADYSKDPVRASYEARIPYPAIDLSSRMHFVQGTAKPTLENTRSVIRVKLHDGRRLDLDGGRLIRLRSTEADEGEDALDALRAIAPEAEWRAASPEAEERVVADWRKAEAFWKTQLPDPRSLYYVSVGEAGVQDVAADLSRSPLVEHLDIASFTTAEEDPLKPVQSGEAAAAASGERISANAVSPWMNAMDIDDVHAYGIVGRKTTFVLATIGVPSPGSGFPPITPFSAFPPFAASGPDNFAFGMAAEAIPKSTIGCVRVSKLTTADEHDFGGGLHALIGTNAPLVYSSDWAILFLNTGLSIAMEYDQFTFNTIRTLVGAGKTIVTHAGYSGIDLRDQTKYPIQPHQPFFNDSGAIIVRSSRGISNGGGRVTHGGPNDNQVGQFASAASIGISATLVESALQQAGQSVPGTPGPINGSIANRGLPLENARLSVRRALDNWFPKPTLRVQSNAPDHEVLVLNSTKALGEIPHTQTKIEGLRVYNDGKEALTVTATMQVVSGADNTACIAELADGSIGSGEGADLTLRLTPHKPGPYTCRLILDTNDPRLPGPSPAERRWVMTYTFTSPADPGSEMRVEDILGNRVDSGKVFDFGVLAATDHEASQTKIIKIYNEIWADTPLVVTVPSYPLTARFKLVPTAGSVQSSYSIPAGDYRSFSIVASQQVDLGNQSEQLFEVDLPFTTNDTNRRNFTIKGKVRLRNREELFEILPGNRPLYLTRHDDRWATLDLGEVSVDESGTWVVQRWALFKSTVDDLKTKWEAWQGPIDAIIELHDDDAKKIGDVLPVDKVVKAGEIIDIALNVTVRPPGVGRVRHPMVVQVTPKDGTQKTYYVILTASLINKGPQKLSIIGPGGTVPLRSDPRITATDVSANAESTIPVGGTLSFGSVQVGSSLAKTVTLQNNGTTAMVVRGLRIKGDSYAFDLPNATIPARTSVPLTVTLFGTRRGPAAATLSFYVDGTTEADNFVSFKLAGDVCQGSNCGSSIPIINSFTATPAAVEAGQSSTLAWNVTNATSVSISPGIGTVTATGTRVVTPTATTDYVLTAVNGSETVTRTVRVTRVGDGPPGSPSITNFRATPEAISAGQPSTLSWTVTNATSLSISPGGPVSGTSLTVTPSATTTYILSATNASGTSTRSATVTVGATTAPVINDFTATPEVLSGPGESAVLAWDVSNATTVSIAPSIGPVNPEGERTVTPSVTTQYTLSATNSAGTTTRQKTVTVQGTSTSGVPPRIQSFTASSTSAAAGTPVTLSWNVENADIIILAPPLTTVNPAESREVSSDATTTYTLFARNSQGSVSQEITVNVSGGPAVPAINEFTVQPQPVVLGGGGEIRWNTSGATNVSIGPDVGTVPASGVKTIRPGIDSLIVLKATNAAGSVSKAAVIDVEKGTYDPLSRSIEILRGTDVETGIRLEHGKNSQLYDPLRGYAAGSIPLLVVNRTQNNITLSRAEVSNYYGGAEIFSLSSELKDVTLAPDQAVPVTLRWSTPVAPRGYRGYFSVSTKTSNTTGSSHEFHFNVPEWRPETKQIAVTDAGDANIDYDLVDGPYDSVDATWYNLGLANSSATATKLIKVHNRGTAPLQVTQAWCRADDFTIRPTPPGTPWPAAIPAGGAVTLRVTGTGLYQSNNTHCVVQVQTPDDPVTEAAFVGLAIRADGLNDAPFPFVFDGNNHHVDDHSDDANADDVVTRIRPNRATTMLFRVRNIQGLDLHLRTPIAVTGNGFRLARNYHASFRTSEPLLRIRDGNYDEALFKVEFTGKGAGTYTGVIKLPMWASSTNALPAQWEHTFEIHWRVVVGNGRAKVQQGQTELDNGSGFDADEETTFTITNVSDGALSLSGLAVPPHYTITSELPRSLAAGQSGSFSASRVTAAQDAEGPHYISFNMDDPEEPIFQVRENRKPVAAHDTATVNAGENVAIDVTANDTDPDGDALSLTPLPIVTPPVKGVVVETADSVFVYSANPGSTGSDRFTYEVGDGNGGVARAEVLVTIGAENRNPVAHPDFATTRIDTPVTIDVVANDVEPDGDPILLITDPVVIPPANGVAAKVDGTKIQYTPNAGFSGTDTFTYEIGDTFGKRARALVTITVNPNAKPVANADTASTLRSKAVKIDVTGNDTDPDGDGVSLITDPIVIAPSHGTAVRASNSEITYTPTAGFVGIDTFTYEIGDGHGARDRAQVTVTIANFGPPAARNDRAYTKRGTSVTIDVLENDVDPDGQAIILTANAITAQPRHGSVARASDRTVTYTPFANYAGNDSFQYEIVDTVGKKDRAWVTVHVGRTRLAPIAVDDAAETPTNQSRSINVVANDSSPDDDVIVLTAAPILEYPRWGTVTRVSDTNLAYAAKNGFVGTDRFKYQITDSEGRKGSAFVTITVTQVNEKPVAVADSAATHMNQPVTVDVTANDSDPDGDPVALIASPIVTAPQHGTAIRVSASSIAYAPAPGFAGTDTFEYEIGDGNGRRARALVNVSVSDTNHPPEAVDDAAVTTAGTRVTVNVTANDSDADGDRVVLIASPIITAPTNGTATKISASEITYTPRAGFTGTDRFQYEVGDGHAGRARAWVDVTVGEGEANHNPVAVQDEASVRLNTATEIEVTANDSDPDGDSVTLIANPIIVAPAHGTAVKVDGKTVRYTPAADYVGVDDFQYEIGDGRGKRSRAWVRVTVEDANSRPVAVNDVASTRPGVAVTVRVIANDSDPDGDPVHITANGIIVAPENGTAANSGGHSIIYTPNAGFRGTDRLQYQIGDGRGLRSRAWLNITVSASGGGGSSAQAIAALSEPVPPIADNDLGEGITDTAVPVVVLANDITIDGRSVVLAAEPVITAPEFGTVTRTSDTTLTFTPAAGFRGNDRFEYEVIDAGGATTRAWAAVQIPGNNQPPVAEADEVTIAREASFVVRPLLNDSDPDGDALVLSLRAVTVQPQHGTVRRDGNHELVYAPEPGFIGDDVFTYEVSDERGGLNEATVTVHVLNATNPPTAANDSGSGQSGQAITIDVLANDADPDGEPLRISASTRPLHGTILWLEQSGTVIYRSSEGYTGTDRFTYTVSDTDGLTAQAEVNVTVTAVNKPPVLTADTAETKTRTAVLIGVLANDWDPEWKKLVVTAVSTPSGGTAVIHRGESVLYEPGPSFAGTDTFQYTVSDGSATPYRATVTVTVLNEAPTPRSEILSAPEDAAVGYQSYNVLGNDTDPDGDELHISDVEQPDHGTFLISPDKQQFSFKGPENWSGMVTFHYTVSDPFGAAVRVMSQIRVHAVNDSPVAVDDSFSVYKNQLLTIPQASVVGNDTDVENHTISIYSIGAPTNGTAQLLEDGSIEYRPYGEFVGADSFEYTIEDHAGGAYGSGRIHVTVLQDTRPTADFTVTCTHLACAFDASASADDRGIVTYQWTLGNNTSASGRTFNYTYSEPGTYAIRLTVTDAIGQSAATQKTVTVRLPNAAPVAVNDAFTGGEDLNLSFSAAQLLANDTDAEGSALRVTAVTQSTKGTLTHAADFSVITFTPNANWFGQDTITYTIADAEGATSQAIVTLTVTSINDAPVAVNDSFTVYKNQLLTLTEAQIIGNDSDVEGHNIYLYGVGAPANGTATKLANNSVEYRPNSEVTGTDSFEYTIGDSAGNAYGTGRVTVTVLQDTAPVASFTFSCTNLVCSFDASASTDDRGIVSYQWTMGNNGAASGRTFSYTYAAAGTYNVRLTVEDVLGQRNVVQKTVIVTCPLPTISAQPTSRAITAGQPTTLTVTAGNATSYQWYQGTAGVTSTPVGTSSNSLTVTPAASASYWVRVRNSCGSTDSAVATVTVCTAPGIATQPASQTINSGMTATLAVVPSGSGPFSYQWYEGASGTTTAPVGINSSSFTTPALTATKSYWVRVTSACNGGVANSNTATVTVTAIQIARRQKAAQTANSQQSITASWTQPTQQGSLLVAVVSALGNGNYPIATFTPPAGWVHAVTSEWSNVKTSIYYYPNNPGGRTAETFATGPSGFRDQLLQLAEYTGVMAASPLDRTAMSGGETNSGQLHTGYTPQTVQGRELVITSLMTNAPATFSSPTDGFTEIHDHTITWSHLATAMHERIVTATGAYGHHANVDNPGAEWVGAVATFKAAN